MGNLDGMTDVISKNLTDIKDILNNHKDEIIKAITDEINKLKEEMKAKD